MVSAWLLVLELTGSIPALAKSLAFLCILEQFVKYIHNLKLTPNYTTKS